MCPALLEADLAVPHRVSQKIQPLTNIDPQAFAAPEGLGDFWSSFPGGAHGETGAHRGRAGCWPPKKTEEGSEAPAFAEHPLGARHKLGTFCPL